MKKGAWKVGIDVQSTTILIVAVEHFAQSCQLKWVNTLPLAHKMTHFGQLIDPAALIVQLNSIKLSLPRNSQCRIALSPSLILQNDVKSASPLPNLQEKTFYIYSALSALFPIAATDLMIDFYELNPCHFVVTAAKKEAVLSWQMAFEQSSLVLDAIDISPCVIRFLARYLQLDSTLILLYAIDEQWLVISPLSESFHYQFVEESHLPAALAQYAFATGCITNRLCDAITLPSQIWQPFTRFSHCADSLPQPPVDFTLAAGLALKASYDLR